MCEFLPTVQFDSRSLRERISLSLINKLSIYERRLLHFLKSKVEPEDQFNSYKLNIKELALALGINKKSMDVQLFDIITGLQNNPVTIETKTSILQATWIMSAYFTEGEIELELTPKMKPFLLSNNFL